MASKKREQKRAAKKLMLLQYFSEEKHSSSSTSFSSTIALLFRFLGWCEKDDSTTMVLEYKMSLLAFTEFFELWAEA